MNNTPRTDAIAHLGLDAETLAARVIALSRELERENAKLCEQIADAIDMLDGNAGLINWRDPAQPELLRKLCECLDAP